MSTGLPPPLPPVDVKFSRKSLWLVGAQVFSNGNRFFPTFVLPAISERCQIASGAYPAATANAAFA
jgi:hypothetical protein